jgi:hypothetical protein
MARASSLAGKDLMDSSYNHGCQAKRRLRMVMWSTCVEVRLVDDVPRFGHSWDGRWRYGRVPTCTPTSLVIVTT